MPAFQQACKIFRMYAAPNFPSQLMTRKTRVPSKEKLLVFPVHTRKFTCQIKLLKENLLVKKVCQGNISCVKGLHELLD